MGITQTNWDNVSKFNLVASGFALGCGVMYLALTHEIIFLGIAMFAAVTCWAAAHMKPPTGE